MKNNQKTFEKLNRIDWHDIPVSRIEFSTDDNSTKFVVNMFLFDELKQDYSDLILEFINVQVLETDKIILTNNSDLELFRFDYKKKENFECKLTFLFGFSEPSLEVKLKCEKINLIS